MALRGQLAVISSKHRCHSATTAVFLLGLDAKSLTDWHFSQDIYDRSPIRDPADNGSNVPKGDLLHRLTSKRGGQSADAQTAGLVGRHTGVCSTLIFASYVAGIY